MHIERRIALGCVLLLAAGCQRPDAAAPATAAPADAQAAPGFAVTVNAVTRTRRIPRSRFDVQEAAAGDTFVVLDVTVSNPGEQTRLFSGGPLIAVDGRRQRRFDTPENIIADGYLLLEALAPGASERGRIVYEVPEHLPGELFWQPTGGKRLRLPAVAAADAMPPTLAQAPEDDASTTAPATAAVQAAAPLPPGPQADRANVGAATPPASASHDQPASSADAGTSQQLRQLACRALVRDDRASDKSRYLHFFQTQCKGVAMPSTWSRDAVATRAPVAPPAAVAAPRPASTTGAVTARAETPEPVAQVAPDDGGPSFDCNGATTRAEQLVCQDALLSLLDRQLADAYASAQRELGDADDQASLQHDQDDWRLRVRDACTSLNCLERAYTRRTAALRAAGGFVDTH